MSRLSCFFAVTLVGFVFAASPVSHAQTAYDSVDPFIGTACDGRTLSIHSTGTGPYVQQLLFDGKKNSNSWLPLSALDQGASKLEFTLSPQPNKQRGQPDSERPPTWLNP